MSEQTITTRQIEQKLWEVANSGGTTSAERMASLEALRTLIELKEKRGELEDD